MLLALAYALIMRDEPETPASALREAQRVLDRMGDFVAAEHIALGSQPEAWEARVEKVLDYHGWFLPELYECVVHLTRAVELMLEE
jgi:hypothetical protein